MGQVQEIAGVLMHQSQIKASVALTLDRNLR